MGASPQSRWRFGPASLFFLGSASVCMLVGTVVANQTYEIWQIRVAITKLSGYSGCMCEDCYARYGIGPPLRDTGCVRSASLLEVSALTGVPAAAFGGLALLIARWPPPRSPDISLCRACRYDLRGLSALRCPECGVAISPADRTGV